MRLNDDDIETIKNALRIAADDCERDAANPCASAGESAAFRESAAQYSGLAEKIDEAPRVIWEADD